MYKLLAAVLLATAPLGAQENIVLVHDPAMSGFCRTLDCRQSDFIVVGTLDIPDAWVFSADFAYDPRAVSTVGLVAPQSPREKITAPALDAATVCPPGFDCYAIKPIARGTRTTQDKPFVGPPRPGGRTVTDMSELPRGHKPESFFSATNLLLGAGFFASGVADVETTLTCMNTTGQTVTPLPGGGTRIETRWCVETKKYIRPFIAAGRWQAHAGKAIVEVPIWVGGHYLRRSRHLPLKVAGWVLPVAGVVIQSKFAVGNVRETRRVRTGQR